MAVLKKQRVYWIDYYVNGGGSGSASARISKLPRRCCELGG